ncbi:dynein regulatory complex subunit 4 [Eupeodes corollae]|uniref:dynein regulatory complex subunit 4 n=1 Tax=Eupeodes corollae TaxID=290404 RepID=UPI0024921D41|nr:dynein regulatory complex subunit 4 [Eupeodes corollae]
MPPKKGKKGKKGPNLIDGVDTSTMNRDQLEAFALRLKAEMEREREERNFFQLERDKIRTFWEIAREQLEEARAQIHNKDREVQEAQEKAENEIRHVIQQMKHLQYENSTKIGEVRAEAMTQLKLAQEEHVRQEQELLDDKRELKNLLREKDETTDLQLQQLKMKNNEEICQVTERFEAEARDMVRLHQEKMQQLRHDMEIKYHMEMFEVEERKDTQIQKLNEAHDAAFNDMKNYYNDITLNNLSLISSLKEEMEELRKQSERSERLYSETLSENKKLVEPLSKARSELVDMRRKLEHYDRDRHQLSRLKTRNVNAEKQLTQLKWESEALILRNDTLVEEREKLKSKFEEVVVELQQKTSLRNVILERKIAQLENDAEKREALLNETFAASGLSPDNMKQKIDSLLKVKNNTIQELHYELARVCKAHDDLLATYEAKLVQFGIPRDELGFEPLRTAGKIKFGSGPAGLVAKNQ